MSAVTLAEAKTHLRISSTAEDTLIQGLIDAAELLLQNAYTTSFINATKIDYFDRFPISDCGVKGSFFPKINPVVSITSIGYTDVDDEAQTVTSTNYILEIDPFAEVTLINEATWPTALLEAKSVVLTYVAGNGADATTVPENTKVAIKMLVGHLYENREATNQGPVIREIPIGIDALMNSSDFRSLV